MPEASYFNCEHSLTSAGVVCVQVTWQSSPRVHCWCRSLMSLLGREQVISFSNRNLIASSARETNTRSWVTISKYHIFHFLVKITEKVAVKQPWVPHCLKSPWSLSILFKTCVPNLSYTGCIEANPPINNWRSSVLNDTVRYVSSFWHCWSWCIVNSPARLQQWMGLMLGGLQCFLAKHSQKVIWGGCASSLRAIM